MKKQTKTLVILAVVLVVLIGAYAGLRLWNNTLEEAEAKASEVAVITLSKLEDISSISFEYEGETLNFSKNSDGQWEYADDQAFPLDESFITTIETTLMDLSAERGFENIEGDESYGLSEPSIWLSAETTSGDSFKISIGSLSGSGSGYYAKVEGDDLIYVVSSDLVSSISYSLLDLVELETFPALSEENIVTVALTSNSGTVNLKKETSTYETTSETDTGEVDENGDAIYETTTNDVTEYTWYLETESSWEEIPEDSSGLSSLLSELASLSFTSCYNYNADSDVFDECSLGDPAYTLTVTYDGGVMELRLGGTDGSGNYYGVLDDSNAINTISSSALSTILTLNDDILLSAEAEE